MRLSARADESVLLFETPALRPELCGALRIQLSDAATVRCIAEQGGALPERIARAAAAVRSQSARLAVLLERDEEPTAVRMVLVGSSPDRAILTIEQHEGRPDPDIDRSLALKVRDALDVIAVAEEVVRDKSPLPALLVPRERAPDRFHLLLEGGGGASLIRRTRAVGTVAFGASVESAQLRGELALTGALPSPITVRSLGRVEEREWALSLSLRMLRKFGRSAVGSAVEAGIVHVSADGVTSDLSASGSSDLVRPRLALALDLRFTPMAGLTLRLAPALELYPINQQFALDRDVRLDLGHVRVLLPLTLLFELPVAREASHAN
jgi:hypothetical protein